MQGAPEDPFANDFRGEAGRVIIVTGAGKGHGAAFAAAWARRGAKVVVDNRHSGDDEPGQIRVAAAGRVCRAMAMEGESLGDGVTPERLAANTDDADMAGAKGFQAMRRLSRISTRHCKHMVSMTGNN